MLVVDLELDEGCPCDPVGTLLVWLSAGVPNCSAGLAWVLLNEHN